MSAVSTETADGTVPVKRLSPRSLHDNAHAGTHASPAAPAPHGDWGAHRWTSLVSAVTLARMGPVSAFLFKFLITHSADASAISAAARLPHAARPGAE